MALALLGKASPRFMIEAPITQVDGKRVLQLPLNLSNTHSVLGPDGSANLGFVAANGPVGLEAVRIHRWRVRRL